MPLRRFLCLLLSLFFTFPFTVTHAAEAAHDPLAGSCDETPVCAALAAEAREHSQAGRFEEAKRDYLQAYQRRADPRLLYNLARVMHKASRSYEAATYYKAYLDAGAEDSKEQKQKAEQYLEQARAEVASTPQQSGLEFSTSQTSGKTSDGSGKPPLYRKWWLWTTVGVVVAGVAIGVGLGLASRRPDSTGAVEARPF